MIVARYICHYDPFSQIIRPKKAVSKRTFFCFNAASGTLHEDLRTFCCYWRHKFSTEVLLYNIHFFFVCIFDSEVSLNTLFCFHCNSGYGNALPCYVIRTIPIFPSTFISVLHYDFSLSTTVNKRLILLYA